MEINEISYDPSLDKILGVFKNKIHIKVYHEDKPVILIITKKLFHETWDNWIKGKREYCEGWNEYCGVMGYTFIEEGEILKSDIKLFEYGEDSVNEIYPTVINVKKFSTIHDFEHG